MAKSFGRMLLSKYIEAIWHTGLVIIYRKEFYYGGGICQSKP